MEEKKVFDFSTPDGKNISVYLLNEDCDEPRLLFIKKEGRYYSASFTKDAYELFSKMFELFAFLDERPDGYISHISYATPDVIDFISNEDNMNDCLNEAEVNHLKAVIARWKEENEVE